MIAALLQASGRVDPRVVLREQFSKSAWDPESWKGMIIVAAAIAIFVLILHFVMYYEKWAAKPRQVNNPTRLFSDVLKQLQLNAAQRSLLTTMARDLKLESATHMLLSPKLFEQAGQKWTSMVQPDSSARADELKTIARELFPQSSAS